MAKKEQEETTPDDNDQVTCTKTSQELKEEVSQKYACVYRTGAVRKTLPHWNRPKSYTRCRPTLAALREGVKAELNNMEKRVVIWKVEEPTDRVNSMAIVEKPDLRICMDPGHLNKGIKRELFQLPSIEHITTRMASAKWFTKIDANGGYWQMSEWW